MALHQIIALEHLGAQCSDQVAALLKDGGLGD